MNHSDERVTALYESVDGNTISVSNRGNMVGRLLGPDYEFCVRCMFRMILTAALGHEVIYDMVNEELDSFEEDLEHDAHGSYGGTQ